MASKGTCVTKSVKLCIYTAVPQSVTACQHVHLVRQGAMSPCGLWLMLCFLAVFSLVCSHRDSCTKAIFRKASYFCYPLLTIARHTVVCTCVCTVCGREAGLGLSEGTKRKRSKTEEE